MKNNYYYRLWVILCILISVWMLVYADDVSDYALAGLKLWGCSVVPVLLPFIIISKLWIYFKVPDQLMRVFQRVFPGTPSLCVTLPIMISGLSAGFPVGAIFIRHYYKNRLLSKKAAESLLPLCSFASPMFIMGYVKKLVIEYMYSGHISKSMVYEWNVMLLALYSPLLILYCFRVMHKDFTVSAVGQVMKSQSASAVSEEEKSLNDIWNTSIEIIVTIGIYIMLLSIVFGFASGNPVFQNPVFRTGLACLEITAGCQYIVSMPAITNGLQLLLLIIVLESGGLCVMAQIASVIADTDLDLKAYGQTRLKCIILSITIYIIISMGFGSAYH